MIDNNPYYTNTCQCKFWHNGEWHWGIVYHDIVVDVVTGEPYKTYACAAQAIKDKKDDWIWEFEWLDLTQYFIQEGVD